MKILKRGFCLVFCLAGLMAHAYAVQAAYSPEYRITAEVDAAAKTITAEQSVTFTHENDGELRELYFYIYPNREYTPQEKDFMMRFAGYFKVNPYPDGFDSGDMDVSSVKAGNKDCHFSVEGKDKTWLKVVLPQPLREGESVTVDMLFRVRVPHAYGRFGWHETILKASRWHPLLAVRDEKGWRLAPFYPFHRPFFSEASRYSVELTVPQDEVVIHSGYRVEEAPLPGHRKKVSLRTDLPVREFTFAMSPDYQWVEGEYEGIALKSFYLPGDSARAQEALDNVKDAMGFYTRLFGPYPYKEFSIAPVHLGYGGEQMSNLIFIDTRVYRLPQMLSRYFDFLISHETGHQWFYNLVGIDEYNQMWLEEGVNSFFITKYLEDKYGRDAGVVVFPEWLEGWEWVFPKLTFRTARDFRYKNITRTGLDSPVVRELSSFQEPSTIFALAYGKGSRIVGMLKYVLGEEAFGRVFKRIFEEHRFGNLDVDDLKRIAEEESGKDLEGFFNDWLYSAKVCDYAVNAVRDNRILIDKKWGIAMPLEVAVDFKDGTQKKYVWDDKNSGELVLDGMPPIARVRLDPREEILDIDRVNNVWPRQLRVKPVPFYWGLYDMPVFLPEDSYNLVFGPETSSGLGFKAALHRPYDQSLYAATDYEFGEALHHSRAGYVLKNVFRSPTTLGVEISNTTDLDNGEDDVVSGKISLRRELWPAQYGLADINDHLTLYLLRNQGLNDRADLAASREDARNVDYSRRNEAIVGTALHINRSGPYPDPAQGYRLDALLESAGHFLGGTQSFLRSAWDISLYQPVTPKTRVAMRLKYGWGYPDDKELFRLGGINGLRGYDRKTVRGANAFLGSVEYRFPLKENLNISFFDNLFAVESVGGVVFFDAGQSWFSDFSESSLKKDAGVGLRLTVNLGSFLEKLIVRVDAAKAINDPDEDTRFWFGVNHAF